MSKFDYFKLISISAILIAAIVLLIIHSDDFDETYTERTTALRVDYKETPYDYAPYHGGRVVTKYDCHYTFEYTVDGNPYYIDFVIGTRSTSMSLDVRYNPANPADAYFDWCDLTQDSEHESWVRIR